MREFLPNRGLFASYRAAWRAYRGGSAHEQIVANLEVATWNIIVAGGLIVVAVAIRLWRLL